MMNYESILIITYGRTGSTLLQGLLNSIDGCLIRGENFGMCQGLFDMYNRLGKSKQFPDTHLSTSPWFGAEATDENYIIEYGREMLRRLLLGNQAGNHRIECYGFKETRYVKMPPDILYEYIRFLVRLFPKPAIIFNTRDHSDVVKSAWWKSMKEDNVLTMFKNAEGVFDRYAKAHDNCYQLTYNDMIEKTNVLRGMFDFLGAEYDPNVINTVLSTPHSYEPTQEHIAEMFEEEFKS